MGSSELPPYTVRESPRARGVRLTVSARDGLVVVVPARYPAQRIPAIVAGRRRWIERALLRVNERRAAMLGGREQLPSRIEMPGIAESWAAEYAPTASATVRARAVRGVVRLSGAVADGDACRAALRRFCRARAAEALPSMLKILSAEEGLAFTAVCVRSQRTRWGSCSGRGSISLNHQLAFLPPRLVRHVMLHELVHTMRLDHSARFHALLAERETDAAHLARELHQAWRHVPGWALDE